MMSNSLQRILDIISRPSEERSAEDIEPLIPWLSRTSKLLQQLQQDIIIKIIQGCEHLTVEEGQVIIKQGDLGDSFYLVLTGGVDIFIASESNQLDVSTTQVKVPKRVSKPKRKPSAQPVENDTSEVHDDDTNKESEQRTPSGVETEVLPPKPIKQLGRFIIKYGVGYGFGELALISESNVRQASVVTNTPTDLLVIHKDLYNQTIKEYQEREYEERRLFVERHPWFRGWDKKTRHLLHISLLKEDHTYDSLLIKQGDPTNGLVFLHRGSAKVLVEPKKHVHQYPDLFAPSGSTDCNRIGEPLLSHRPDMGVLKLGRKINPRQQHVAVRRKEGYAAAERLAGRRQCLLYCVSQGEVLGDVEVGFGLSSYCMTFLTTSPSQIFRLTQENFDRLVPRKHPKTLEKLHKLTETKLHHLVDTPQGQDMQLFKTLLYMRKNAQNDKPTKGISQSKAIEKVPFDKDTLFQHQLQLYLKNKAQLVKPYTEDALIFREIIREKDNVPSATLSFINGKKKLPVLEAKRQTKARTTGQLKAVLEEEAVTKAKEEQRHIFQQERRKEQRELASSYEDFVKTRNIKKKKLKGVKFSDLKNGVEPNTDPAEVNVDSSPIEKCLTERNQNMENGHNSNSSNVEQEAILANPDQPNPNKAFSNILEITGDLSVQNNNLLPQGTDREAKTHTQAFNRLPAITNIFTSEESVPIYKEWETSNLKLSLLEDRLKAFRACSKTMPTEKPYLSTLRRFENQDYLYRNPRPGGKVLIRKRDCALSNTQFQLATHSHVHIHIVSSIPQYSAKLRKNILKRIQSSAQKIDN